MVHPYTLLSDLEGGYEEALQCLQEFAKDRIDYEELERELPAIAARYDEDVLRRVGDSLEVAETETGDTYFTNLGFEREQPTLDREDLEPRRESSREDPTSQPPELNEREFLERHGRDLLE